MKIITSNQNIIIRKLEDNENDYKFLLKWLTDQNVLEYYYGRDKEFNYEEIKNKFQSKINQTRLEACIIEYENKPIGYLQFYELDKEDVVSYDINFSIDQYGIDLFIGETEYWDKGIGSDVLKLIINYIKGNLNGRKILIDPHTSNQRAIKAYEKVGFKKIKILPNHELHEGIKKDSWLMEINFV